MASCSGLNPLLKAVDISKDLAVNNPMDRPLARAPLALLLGLSAFVFAAPLSAQTVEGVEDEAEYSRPSLIESSQVVRRKLLFRSTRFEITPMASFTLADTFNRNILAGANLAFHLTNQFGLGATFNYGVLSPQTSLGEALVDPVSGIPDDNLAELATTRVNWLASVEGSYVPLFGKLSIMNGAIVNYDFHLLFGMGFVNLAAVTPLERENIASANIPGSTIAPVVGIGTRFYLNDFIAFNAQLRDFIYSSPAISNTTNSDADLQNRLALSVGFSFFLPTAVKVSR